MADKIDYKKDRRGRNRFPITHEKAVRDSNWVRLEEKLNGIAGGITGKQETLVSGENIKTIGGQSVLGAGNIPISDPDAVKKTAQTLTAAEKAQILANIGAASSAEVEALADQKYEGPYASESERPEASAQTMGAIYLVGPDENDEYDRTITKLSNGSYSWTSLGKTAIVLANYASKESLNGLQAEIVKKTKYQEQTADLTESAYINSSGKLVSSSAWTTQGFKSNPFNSIFSISYSSLSGSYRDYKRIAFYNSETKQDETTFISGVSFLDTASGISLVTSIPIGCKFIMVSSRNADGDAVIGFSLDINYVRGISADLSKLATIANNPSPDGNYYVSSTTGRKFNNDSWRAYKIPVVPGVKVDCTVVIVGSNIASIAFFDANDAMVSNVGGVSGSSQRDYSATAPSGAVYAIVSNREESYNTPTIKAYYEDAITIVRELSKESGELDSAIEKRYSSFGRAIRKSTNVVYSDMTWVGDKLVGFASSSDDLSTSGKFTAEQFANGIDKYHTGSEEGYHTLGHANTVDYCPENDCLILGNGSGSYTLDGKIIIVESFSQVVENIENYTEESPLSMSSPNVIVIDCTSYDLGTKFNVMWGENNIDGGGLLKYNIAYLITAKMGSSQSNPDAGDNGVIRRILLGTGNTQLSKGLFISGKSDSEFNGTFEILATYTQSGTNYYNGCNQGTCFKNGKIWSAVNHEGITIWAMRLSDGKIYRDEYKQETFDADGTLSYHNVSGICMKDGYIFVGAVGFGVMCFRP